MVYQRGDTHTVVSSQPAGPEATEEEAGSFLVTIQSDGQAVVTQAGVAVEGDEEGVLVEQALAIVSRAEEESNLVSHGDQVGIDNESQTVTLIGRDPKEEDGETLTVVTHSGQAGASDSLAVVSACLAMEQPQKDEPVAQDPAATALVLSEETPAQQGASSQAAGTPEEDPNPDTTTATTTPTTTETSQEDAVSTTTSLEVVPIEAVAELEPPPPKRKRGRPFKVKKEVVVMEEEVFSFHSFFFFFFRFQCAVPYHSVSVDR